MTRGHVSKPRTNTGLSWSVIALFGLVGGVAAVALLVLFLPDIRAVFEDDPPANDNRTWLTRAWTEVQRPEDEFAAMTAILNDNGIRGVYLQTHQWNAEAAQYVLLPFTESFVQRFRTSLPDMPIYAWLTVNRAQLSDPAARIQVAASAEAAINDVGVDGIHLQAISVPDASENYLLLLRDLRASAGGKALSVTVPPDRSPADPDIPASPNANNDLTWSPDFKRSVTLIVDEIVLMGHASGLDSIDDYEEWLSYQVRTYDDLVNALEIDISYIVSLPTYDFELAHDPEVENVTTAINGTLDAMAASDDPQVDGVGLYPWELTDLLELDAYWEQWVQRE